MLAKYGSRLATYFDFFLEDKEKFFCEKFVRFDGSGDHGAVDDLLDLSSPPQTFTPTKSNDLSDEFEVFGDRSEAQQPSESLIQDRVPEVEGPERTGPLYQIRAGTDKKPRRVRDATGEKIPIVTVADKDKEEHEGAVKFFLETVGMNSELSSKFTSDSFGLDMRTPEGQAFYAAIEGSGLSHLVVGEGERLCVNAIKLKREIEKDTTLDTFRTAYRSAKENIQSSFEQSEATEAGQKIAQRIQYLNDVVEFHDACEELARLKKGAPGAFSHDSKEVERSREGIERVKAKIRKINERLRIPIRAGRKIGTFCLRISKETATEEMKMWKSVQKRLEFCPELAQNKEFLSVSKLNSHERGTTFNNFTHNPYDISASLYESFIEVLEKQDKKRVVKKQEVAEAKGEKGVGRSYNKSVEAVQKAENIAHDLARWGRPSDKPKYIFCEKLIEEANLEEEAFKREWAKSLNIKDCENMDVEGLTKALKDRGISPQQQNNGYLRYMENLDKTVKKVESMSVSKFKQCLSEGTLWGEAKPVNEGPDKEKGMLEKLKEKFELARIKVCEALGINAQSREAVSFADKLAGKKAQEQALTTFPEKKPAKARKTRGRQA
ncbi:MAG: hypothetical protein LBJ09_03235 [Clostridiales bacterium]|jgi:hypothetical protein|nr:hypothetical protein [Clostridiales bacterium]